MTTTVPLLREITESTDGRLDVVVNFHAGQWKAYNSLARIIAVLCGTQWGKTEMGSHWMYREIERRGPGDYLVGTSTFQLLQNKLLPDFLRVFVDLYQLGKYSASAKVFTFSEEGEYRMWGEKQDVPTRILLFSGQSPEGAEAATAKAAWLDEAGQEDFKEETFEAIERRLAIHQGRILITTTLYNFGWLKRRIYDPWLLGSREIEIIQSDSIVNPAFPRQEWDRAKRNLPAWKFDLFYRGRYTRPAGAVYDCFDTAYNCISPQPISADWPILTGHDFGPANMAAIWIVQNTDVGEFWLYRGWKRHGTRSAAEDVREWMSIMKPHEKKRIIASVGGVPRTEDGWREAFTAAGWPISPPAAKVGKPAQQILRTYGLFKSRRLKVFSDQTDIIDDIIRLSYKLDDQQQPINKYDNDAECHYAAALRYIASYIDPEVAVEETDERPQRHY